MYAEMSENSDSNAAIYKYYSGLQELTIKIITSPSGSGISISLQVSYPKPVRKKRHSTVSRVSITRIPDVSLHVKRHRKPGLCANCMSRNTPQRSTVACLSARAQFGNDLNR